MDEVKIRDTSVARTVVISEPDTDGEYIIARFRVYEERRARENKKDSADSQRKEGP